jgi:preprotein translocase subunit SecD
VNDFSGNQSFFAAARRIHWWGLANIKTKMKTILRPLVSLLALTLVAAETSKPPVFQMRLVLDSPTADSEQMTMTRTDTTGKTTKEVLQVPRTSLLDHKEVRSASVQKNAQTGAPEIQVTFTDQGAKRFAQVTRENIDKRLAIVVDGKVFSAPFIKAEIPGGHAVISGNFSEQEATQLATKINDAVTK